MGAKERLGRIASMRRRRHRQARRVDIRPKSSTSPKTTTVQTEDASQQMTYADLKRLAWEYASEILRDQQDMFVQGFLAGYMCSGVGLGPDRPEKK